MMEKIFGEPWPWWVSGPLVGLYVLAFLYFKNRSLGASSAYQAVMEAASAGHKARKGEFDFAALSSKTALPQRPGDSAPNWRIWWLGGLLLGGLLAWALGGAGTGTLHLPGFPEFFGTGFWGSAALLFCGGLLIGAGTRASGGCTSGHAITGISSLQWPSVAATAVFFAVGMALTFALRGIIGS